MGSKIMADANYLRNLADILESMDQSGFVFRGSIVDKDGNTASVVHADNERDLHAVTLAP